MRKTLFTLLATLIASSILLAQSTPPAKKPAAKTSTSGNQAKIRLAMSGAPADISRGATIVEMNDKGEMKELRKGTNGWTCMPSAGGAAGVAGADPMCLDQTWMKWADAWMHKTDPKIDRVGVGYMLRGDKGASNTDPFATTRTPTNQWIVSPPHVMMLVPDAKMLDSLPTDPHGGGAWVMWKGTKYAHIMVPVSPVPTAK